MAETKNSWKWREKTNDLKINDLTAGFSTTQEARSQWINRLKILKETETQHVVWRVKLPPAVTESHVGTS